MERREALALLEACRPLNVGLGALATLLGAWLAGGPACLAASRPWLAAGATLLCLPAGNLWNDLADLREDAVNRPSRPLVSGRLRAGTARRAAWLLAACGSLAGLALGMVGALTVLACLSLLAWYARRGKEAGLAGNLAVAALGAAAVGLGGVACAASGGDCETSRLLAPAALAGLLHLQREVVKDIQDRPGDRVARRGSWVLASTPGQWRRLLLFLAALSALPPLAALLFLQDPPALRAAHWAALWVAPLLLLQVWSTRWDWAPSLARLSRRIKLLLAAGLLLYALAGTWL